MSATRPLPYTLAATLFLSLMAVLAPAQPASPRAPISRLTAPSMTKSVVTPGVRPPLFPIARGQEPKGKGGQPPDTPAEPPDLPTPPTPSAPPELPTPPTPSALPTPPTGIDTAASEAARVAAERLTGAPPTATAATAGTETAPRAEVAPASAVSTSITGAGGVAGAALGAPDVGEFLARSPTSVGVEVQRRNAIVGDPRIRGYRAGQYLTYGDGGLFVPARLDLDTAAAKFDPGTVRDIVVVKGPYSALYGPGLSFLDVATLDSPRYRCFEVHGRTAGGYQTNGRRWDALQSVSVGERDWGFRGTYNILQGNDYRAGDGTRVPSSYLSNNVNFAVGWDPTDKSRIEFKGLRVVQNGLEFPGLYFDIRQSDTEAYSARYSLFDQGSFDQFTLDAWYNYTAASGDTRGGAKQAFVQRLLGVSFNPQLVPAGITPENPFLAPLVAEPGAPPVNLFRDFSDTRFAARTVGYRAALSWGPKADPFLTVGNDFSTIGQGLVESIRFEQLQGLNLNTGRPVAAGDPANTFTQTQRIPESNQINPGLFVQSALPLTPRWKLRSGGRIDYVFASSNPRLIEGSVDLFGPPASPGFPRPARFLVDPIQYSFRPNDPELDRGYTLLAGFLQNEYKLDPNWTARLAVGHSQRAPTLTELYASGPFVGVLQQGTSRLIGDPNLLPEKLTQFDLGLSADYEFLQLGATAFYAWVNDYITYDQNLGGLGLTQVVYTNTDLATLAGAEVFGQANLAAWLTGFGTLSYVQGIDQTATDRRRAANLDSSRRDDPLRLRRKSRTEPLPQIPPLEGRVGLRFHAPSVTPRWQVEFSARMATGQNHVATSLNEYATPGFTIFNVRGFWRLTDSLLVSAGVENVGDKTYREHLDPVSGNLLGVGPLLRPGTNFFFNTQITY